MLSRSTNTLFKTRPLQFNLHFFVSIQIEVPSEPREGGQGRKCPSNNFQTGKSALFTEKRALSNLYLQFNALD